MHEKTFFSKSIAYPKIIAIFAVSKLFGGNGRIKIKYKHVSLSKNGIISGVSVHKLVALTFPEICGEWFEGAEVSHLDENPHNNKPENLRWVEHITNINWGTRNKKAGLSQRNRPDCSKPVVQYTLDGEYVADFPSGGEAERKTGIKRPNISACCRGIVEAAGGYIWKYKNGS